MTTYTPILNAEVDAESPITDLLLTRLRDNPLAIGEGAASAPRIDPIAAMAHQGAAGAVGTYAFAKTATSFVNAGDTIAGSSLRLSRTDNSAGAALTGTWRNMGYTINTTLASLVLRIS